MDRNENTRDESTPEARLKKLEEGFVELAKSHTNMRQFCKLLEQDNSMALHSIHALAEIKEIRVNLETYIKQRGEMLKTFDQFLKG